MREALRRPPCGVAFSGGRDSSAVLAVATHVARREGLPEPLPITRVFPGVPAAEETEWQETVVRHLGLDEWQRVRIDDELDLVGPLATTRLLEHGVVWPPTTHVDIPLLELLEGGSLLDGEGGDDVLGVSSHRVAPLTNLIRAPMPLRWRRVRSALGALAPRGIRARHVRRQYCEWPLGWLRPVACEALLDALSDLSSRQPLRFSASVRAIPQHRSIALGTLNRKIFAEQRGVTFESPLLHHDFVHALAREGGLVGRGDRTAVLRKLVADLLPAAVLERVSKAEFGGRVHDAPHPRVRRALDGRGRRPGAGGCRRTEAHVVRRRSERADLRAASGRLARRPPNLTTIAKSGGSCSLRPVLTLRGQKCCALRACVAH